MPCAARPTGTAWQSDGGVLSSRRRRRKRRGFVTGDENDRDAARGEDMGDGIDPLASNVDIEKRDVDLCVQGEPQGLIDMLNRRHDLASQVDQHVLERQQNERFILDNEYPQFRQVQPTPPSLPSVRARRLPGTEPRGAGKGSRRVGHVVIGCRMSYRKVSSGECHCMRRHAHTGFIAFSLLAAMLAGCKPENKFVAPPNPEFRSQRRFSKR